MNRPGRITLTLLALALGPQAGAEELYKCKNAAGKITYSGQECSQIGLTSAGEVKGKTNITPALKFPAQPAPTFYKVPTDQAASQAPGAKPAAPAEDGNDPSRRCFTVKTAKGTATRCNDDPDKAD
jgi:hypothetical protein